MNPQHLIDDALSLLRQCADFPEYTLAVLTEHELRVCLLRLRVLAEQIWQAHDDEALLWAAHALLRLVACTPTLRGLGLLDNAAPAGVDPRQRETELARYLAQNTTDNQAHYHSHYHERFRLVLLRLQQVLAQYPQDTCPVVPARLSSREGAPMISDRLAQVEFAANHEPRCAVVLLLDTSESMNDGQRIRELNEGLATLRQSLVADSLAALRVELALVTFGGSGAQVINLREGRGTEVPDADRAFVGASLFVPPQLSGAGTTPLGAGGRLALKLIRDRKAIYKANGLDYYRPWLLLITDGEPNDVGWEEAAQQVRDEQNARRLLSFAIGVEDANMQKLARFSTVPPKKLRGLAFGELFRWLSKSLAAVSRSRTGDTVQFPTTDSWSGGQV